MERPTDSYQGRIRRALKQGPRPMSVRDLAKEMGKKHPHLRGTSYGGIRQYAEGKVQNPRVELLRAIAETLGVRPDFLAFNQGEMTDDEERAAALVEGVAMVALAGAGEERAPRSIEELGLRYWQEALRLRDSVLDGWAKTPGLHLRTPRHMPYWVAPLAAVCQRLGLDPTHAGEVLLAPLRALGIDPAEMNRGRGEALSSYIISMVPVLMALAPELDRERTAAEEDRQHDQQSDE